MVKYIKESSSVDGTILGFIELEGVQIPIVFLTSNECWSLSACQTVFIGGDVTSEVNYSSVIYVDGIFLSLSDGAQKFLLMHECGHILKKDSLKLCVGTPEYIQYIQNRTAGIVEDIEVLADEYSCTQCTYAEVSEVIGVFSCICDLSVRDGKLPESAMELTSRVQSILDHIELNKIHYERGYESFKTLLKKKPAA